MTLAEQWKKGELEDHKKYYCKTKWFEDILQARCYNKGTEDEWWVLENEKYKYNSIYHTKDIEVLAPVPSYDHFVELTEKVENLSLENTNLLNLNYRLNKWCEEFNALDVSKENQQLKGYNEYLRNIIKECEPYIENVDMEKFANGVFLHTSNALLSKIRTAIGEKK